MKVSDWLEKHLTKRVWLAVMIVLGIILMVPAVILIKRVFVDPGVAKQERAQATADVGGAKVQAENARDGVATGDRIIERNHEIERITRENTVRIMAAPGAGVAADPGFAPAWRGALCLRDAYRDSAACIGVSDPVALVGDAAYPAGADSR